MKQRYFGAFFCAALVGVPQILVAMECEFTPQGELVCEAAPGRGPGSNVMEVDPEKANILRELNEIDTDRLQNLMQQIEQ